MGKTERLQQQIHEAEERWKKISQRLKALKDAYDLETRVEEKLRLDAIIAEAQKSKSDLATEIAEKEAQLTAQPMAVGQPATAATPGASSSGRAQVQLFAIFAPEDKAQALELDKHLAPLQNAGMVSPCYQPPPLGDKVKEHVDRCYREADWLLALISSDLLNNRECVDLLTRAIGEGRRLIPVLLSAADWQNTVLGGLACLPADGSTISEARNKVRAWHKVIQELKKVLPLRP